MIIGLGIDMTEIERIESLLNRKPSFIDRILTPKEKEMMPTATNRRRAEWVAGRFAAKEAYSKALGTGIGEHCSFQDIEITRLPSGKPMITGPHAYNQIAHVSITHSLHHAMAQVIIEERKGRV